jgi:hypothetical protein
MQIKIPKRIIALTEAIREMMREIIVIMTAQTVISLGKRHICIVLWYYRPLEFWDNAPVLTFFYLKPIDEADEDSEGESEDDSVEIAGEDIQDN